MPSLALYSIVFSVLVPSKMWYAPSQPIDVTVKADAEVTLVLTDFTGKRIDADGATPAVVAGGKSVDVKTIYKTLATPGTYVLFAVPKGQGLDKFAGTPLVIGVRESKHGPQGAIVVKVEPLRYAVMSTDKGDMTMVFYYDVAPNTANSFLSLAGQGYYDGLTFHRIIPEFVIQGGDPRGDGQGGPGYTIMAEFNNRKHEPGVLSMARLGDPSEAPGVMPRSEYANSAGSQFFVCLDYKNTVNLDNKYTAFGKVVQGMDTVKAIAGVPLANKDAGRPANPPAIKKTEVLNVTAEKNPYAAELGIGKP